MRTHSSVHTVQLSEGAKISYSARQKVKKIFIICVYCLLSMPFECSKTEI